MSDVYLIEVDDRAVGLVAREHAGRAYRFHAAVPKVHSLDGMLFPSPDHARRAARRALQEAALRGRGSGIGDLDAVA